MDVVTVEDRIARGLGVAARAIGVLCDAFRPTGTTAPLDSANRVLQISAAFNPRDPHFRSASLPTQPIWYGVFDTAYLQPGDYLQERASGRVWFIGATESLLPATCVLTNRTIAVVRPAVYSVAGVNVYGGGGTVLPLIDGFPVSLLHGGVAHTSAPIAADTRAGGVIAQVPFIGGVEFTRGDRVTDDLGREFVVSSAEQNSFGWRLDLRQAAS